MNSQRGDKSPSVRPQGRGSPQRERETHLGGSENKTTTCWMAPGHQNRQKRGPQAKEGGADPLTQGGAGMQKKMNSQRGSEDPLCTATSHISPREQKGPSSGAKERKTNFYFIFCFAISSTFPTPTSRASRTNLAKLRIPASGIHDGAPIELRLGSVFFGVIPANGLGERGWC